MHKVRITAVRKVAHLDLSAQYENPIQHACDIQEGQTWISHEALCPNGFCTSAWQSLQPL